MGLALDEVESYGLTLEQREEAVRAALDRQRARKGAVVRDLSDPRILHDVLLAHAYRCGQPQAVDAVRRTYRGLVRNIARQFAKPDVVDEIEAEMWAALWEKLGAYVGMSTLRTWLNVVVRNWCVDRCRAAPPPGPDWENEDGLSPLDLVAAPDARLDQSSACAEFSAAMDDATRVSLLRLEARDRALLRLRFVHDMPLETLRHRPEIYSAGDEILPVYGMTRRIQRVARHLREWTTALLETKGFAEDTCVQMLADCEGLAAETGHRMFAHLQTTAAPPSAASREENI